MDTFSSIGMETLLKKQWDDQFDDLVTHKKVLGNLFVTESHIALSTSFSKNNHLLL